MTAQRDRTLWIASAALAGLGLIYIPLVLSDPLLTTWDDIQLLAPLREVHSLADYLRGFSSGAILDLQPIRDASYLIDISTGRLLGVSLFHFTNLAIWLAVIAAAFLCLRNLYGASTRVTVACALFAIHPAMVDAVAWVGARKHLLSALFCLLATLGLLSARDSIKAQRPSTRYFLGALACYVLAAFSHPGAALWPIWMILYLQWEGLGKNASARSAAAIAFTLMIGIEAANYFYYSEGPYLLSAPQAKLIASDPAVGLLAYGRYTLSLFFPFQLSIAYSAGFVSNAIGLLVIPILLWLASKAVGARRLILWSVFILFPLLPTTVLTTNIWAMDDYLVISAFGVVNLALLCFGERGRSREAKAAIAAVALVFEFLAIAQAQVWRSDYAIWQQAADRFPTPSTVRRFIIQEVDSGQSTPALLDSIWIALVDASDPYYPELMIASLRADHYFGLEEKAEVLRAYRSGDPRFDFELGRLELEAGILPQSSEKSGRGQLVFQSPASSLLIQDYLEGRCETPSERIPGA